jgi:hypothetical protein
MLVEDGFIFQWLRRLDCFHTFITKIGVEGRFPENELVSGADLGDLAESFRLLFVVT